MRRVSAGLFALSLLIGLLAGPARATTFRDAVAGLLPRLWEASPPGEVLFREDFAAGNLDHWKPDQGWGVVDKPEGGKCAQVVASDQDNEDLILKQQIPVKPGHPIAVCWKTRFVTGSDPLYLRVDFFDETGKTGQPYARQDISREGPQWIENTMVVSDWFPPYTRAITIWFHHVPGAKTTSLLSDIRVVDLAPAAQALVAGELPKAKAQSEQLARAAGTLPRTGLAGKWRQLITTQLVALKQALAACDGLEPGSPELDRALGGPATALARLSEAVAGLKAGGLTTERLLAYATTPVTSQMVLPYSAALPGAQLGRLSLTACPGETESASLVVWAPAAVRGLRPQVSALKGPGGVIPASAVDLKWVKCWYQAGTAPRGVVQDRLHKVLVPELLLSDDSLVQVDLEGQRNSLKLSFPGGARYVPVDDPTPPKPTWGLNLRRDEYPVKDAATLQPLDLPAGQNKQVWLTLRVPANCPPGKYTGKVTLTALGKSLGEVPLTVQVLPFTLETPRTHYDLTRPFTGSLYYWGELDKTGAGGIGYKLKSEEQFRAELKAMYDHGIVAPAMIWSPDIVYRDEPSFRRHLQLAKDAGMAGRPLYFADSGLIGAPTAAADLAALQDNIRRTLRIAAEYGFPEVYFYGIDEARGETLQAERGAWQAVHEAGGKVIVSGFQGQLEAVGDLLDLFNRAGEPAADNAAAWHQRGHLIWNYANPQTPAEDPELYRRNYGLYLWRLDYDGACTYCFMDSSGAQWNDIDDDTYRDHCLAYPTVDGVVTTVALAGFREGQDDLRYVSTLRTLIARDPDTPLARESLAWLDGLDMRTANLDTVRAEAIRRIMGLRK